MVAPWLIDWFATNDRRHRTVDDGTTFCCPRGNHHEVRMTKLRTRQQLQRCPFCQQPLGPPTPIPGEPGGNRQWN